VSVLVASDLDGTLIYSRRSAGVSHQEADLRCVEYIDDEPVSFMTEVAARCLERVSALVEFVPATARSQEQYARLALPAAVKYAVLANGGLLLVGRRPDASWSRVVANRLAGVVGVDEVTRHVEVVSRPEWTIRVRRVESLFCYAVIDPRLLPVGFVGQEQAWAELRGWRTSLQGNKFYWVPRALTKAAAVAEVVGRCSADAVVAAGDALLDADLLEYADAGVHPSHGELAATGWSADSVVRLPGLGVLAGQEIIAWLGATAAALAATGSTVR